MPARTQNISTFVDQTLSMPARKQNVSKHVMTKPIRYYFTIKASHRVLCQHRHNLSQDVLTKSLPCHKMHLNMCSATRPMPASSPEIHLKTFDKTRSMPKRSQNASQLVLIKPILCQLGHKMYLNLC